ncbi:MAG: FecR family protein [Zunongwangia sp.]|uniref:FecR family protein n=1 Tax=Zunongwangia sp. TaxID=1965325 RepID=UPI0032422A46
MQDKIENIISKVFTNQATESELEMLENWLEKPAHRKIFNSFLKTQLVVNSSLKSFNTEKSKNDLIAYIQEEKKRSKRRKILQITRYAAILILLLSIGGYVFKDSLFNTENKVVENTIERGSDKARLTLSDGTEIILKEGTSYKNKNASSNGSKIAYAATNDTSVLYNTLTIPRGGQFYLELADGSHVWLNSESKLRYPTTFIKGNTRMIELIYGEAYFDISPSRLHGGSGFELFHNQQKVEVLGTEFNVKGYSEENLVYTTLVEGSIALSYKNQKFQLSPNQQSVIDTQTGSVLVQDVDVFNEVSWKDGIFSFEGKTIGEIMIVLSRWYDMEVIYKNPNVRKVKFNGILDKDQDIQEILKTIKDFNVIKKYDIQDKKVILY